jgi:hypothetical protein
LGLQISHNATAKYPTTLRAAWNVKFLRFSEKKVSNTFMKISSLVYFFQYFKHSECTLKRKNMPKKPMFKSFVSEFLKIADFVIALVLVALPAAPGQVSPTTYFPQSHLSVD